VTPPGRGALRVALLVLAAHTGVARGEAPPRHTVSVGLPGLVYRGVAAELERDLPASRIGVVGGLQLRSTAAGDYGSTTIGVAGEVRAWLRRRAVWTARPAGSPVGWYAAARIDLARTQLADDAGTALGAHRTVGLALLVGYRLAPWRGLELRPYAGPAWRRDVDAAGRLAPWSRGSLALGLAAGWSW
jgi:hypothetical protein